MTSVQSVGVIGAGIMGAGIAQVMAQAGFPVVLIDISQTVLDKGIQTITGGLGRLVKKNKMTEAEMQGVMAHIKPSLEYKDLADTDLIIEVVSEKFDLKQKIFSLIHAVAKPSAIIASNTSSISITKLAAAAGEGRADHFVGMHFFNPVPVMKLVEVIKGLQTSDEAFDAVCACVDKLSGKEAVPCTDSPGFVCNRILVPMVNEAAFALFESVATPADIDRVMKLGANHPMGPLKLADMIGLDTILSVTEVLHAEFGDDKYRPCPLIRKMVAAGHLGQKTGRGFYDYSQKSKL
jgi:3-hydroxybutyryl-CoA dehydrogenase